MATENQTQSKPSRNAVQVVTEMTTAIKVGSDNYLLKGTADGRGVNIQNKQGSLFIPYGAAGTAILENLTSLLAVGSGRKRRRTKAEIEAANANNSEG